MRPAVILLSVVFLLLLAPTSGRGEDVLFKDDFKHGLSEKWEVVGLKKADYRVREGGLEMRVHPGKLARDTPMIKVILPFTAADSVIASVTVVPLDEFTQEHELAGIFLIDKDGRDFAAKKERVEGKLVFAPGNYRFKGKPGGEGDPANYVVEYTPATEDAGPLQLTLDRGYAYFRVGPSAKGKYLDFFHSAIGTESKEWGFCLTAVGAPKDAAHWVRFEDFRVVR